MKTITAICSLTLGITLASEPKEDRPYSAPKSRSEMDIKSTEILLKSGITDGDLANKLNTIPLVRMDYIVYFLADGALAIPSYENNNAKVTQWKTEPNGKPLVINFNR